MRLRDHGLTIGTGQPGPGNAITDVAGVGVGHTTLIAGSAVRTGVTVVLPRPGYVRDQPLFAGACTFNGNGELTGLEWVRESGLLTTPIAITNTHSVGVVRDALVAHDAARMAGRLCWSMPTVGETYDGILNDVNAQHVTAAHVDAALAAAGAAGAASPVEEGSVGGGTGMICHEFKGGIGTASRIAGEWTVGVLVQANHGLRRDLRLDGLPVGRWLTTERVPTPSVSRTMPLGSGSIIIIVATDAPLLPDQCRRLAARATIGMARAGGGTSDSSGDIFLAFSTGNTGIAAETYQRGGPVTASISMVNHQYLGPLFDAAAEATEEAIWNAMMQAGTMVGRDGVTAHGLEPDLLFEAIDAVTAQLHRTKGAPSH